MADTATNPSQAVAECIQYLAPILHEYNRLYSVRGILIHLGYDHATQQAVLAHCAERGFGYCLDQTVTHLDGSHPPQDACRWYPDQLHSRLSCV